MPDGYQVGPVNTDWLDVFTYPLLAIMALAHQSPRGMPRPGRMALLTLEIPTESQRSPASATPWK